MGAFFHLWLPFTHVHGRKEKKKSYNVVSWLVRNPNPILSIEIKPVMRKKLHAAGTNRKSGYAQHGKVEIVDKVIQTR